jgi:hypothetical protein
MATTAELLTQAKDALHKLITGEAVAEFRDADGSTVRYTQASRGALRAYITELEVKLARENKESRPTGPMQVWGP